MIIPFKTVFGQQLFIKFIYLRNLYVNKVSLKSVFDISRGSPVRNLFRNETEYVHCANTAKA